MLSRSKRLRVPLFTNVLANGRIVHSLLFTARIAKVAGSARFSAVVSKKIAKTAVERNKLRRRIYSALRTLVGKVRPNFHFILLAKPTIKKAPVKEITTDIEGLFVKSGIMT